MQLPRISPWWIFGAVAVLGLILLEVVASQYGYTPLRTAARVVWDFYTKPVERPTFEELDRRSAEEAEESAEGQRVGRAGRATTPASPRGGGGVPSAAPGRGTSASQATDGASSGLPMAAAGPAASGATAGAAGTSGAGATELGPTELTEVLFAMPRRRVDRYVPGNVHGWSEYPITIDEPTLVRAGGEVQIWYDVAGPAGLSPSYFERDLNARGVTAQRVLRSAPFLALIGRLCANQICSAPFLVGSQTVLCPSRIGLAGQLQLWTNNYVQIDGFQTLLTYSRAFGGYTFHVEPAAPGSCGEAPPPARTSTATLAGGGMLRDPAFVVSSGQTAWRPFFLPLDEPLVIHASGQVRPRAGAPPTGPEGIPVPDDVEEWTYPGARQVRVDETSVLVAPGLPFQALIARRCGGTRCGEVFVVGRERTLCPTPGLNERLELWINYTERVTGLASGSQNQIFDALSRQLRQGDYRFEIAPAPAGACQ
jgi:hypothetical protein